MLRPMTAMDLEWVREERNNPENRKWFRQNHLISPEEQKSWWAKQEMDSFMVIEDYPVGVVSLSHFDYNARKCEFSIMITPDERGKGYGRKAMRELLDHAFDDLNMYMVYSDVFEHNPAMKLYEEVGFKQYGKLPNWYWKDGKYINSIVIAITRSDYLNNKPDLNRDVCLKNEGRED